MCQSLLLFFIHLIGNSQGQFNEPNIALRKPASQFPGDYCSNRCYTADLAVDGELDPPNKWEGHCTHTSGTYTSNAFWTVNFMRFYPITGIIVHNRISDLEIGRRLRDFSVYGLDAEQMTSELLYKYNYTFTSASYDPVIKITLPSIPYVSGIRIEIPNRNSDTEDAVLTLCEVEVYSDLVCPNLTLNSFTLATYTNYTNHESIASFNCTEGYELNETFPLVCKGWQWDRKPPACEIIYCPFPPELRYGNYTLLDSCSQKQDTHLPFNCLIEANCRTGYNLTQGETRRCLSSKQWSTPNSVCELVKCSLPYILHGNVSLKNGSVVYDDRIDYGTEIYVTCDIGYNISSAHTRICQQDGKLSGAKSECIVVMCDHPGNIANGSYRDISNNLYLSGHMNYSDIINFNCDTGYIIKSGLSTRKCQYTGKWSDVEPECTLVTCQPLEKISDLVYTYSDQNASAGYVYGSSVNVSCETGMIQQGSNVRRCTAEGTWDGTSSTCKTDSSKPLYLIGVVIGSVVGLVIIIVIVLVILKRRGLLWWRSKQDNSIRFNDLQNDGHILSVQGTAHRVENTLQPVTSENTYYGFGELTADKYPETAILIKDLPNLVLTEKAVADKFKEQYENLPKGMQEKHMEALKPQNTGKNRYKGLYAYDSSRVVLNIDSENKNDYINACYINGFHKTKAYIASQGPTAEILTDFWRMVWQTSCRKIVMLTNITELGKPKCHQYWSDEGDIFYGNIMVTIKGAEIFSDFIIRKFAVKKENLDEREVLQYHFTAWPDKGVPKYASSLVQFRNKVKCDEKPGEGPLVVHCSAGVGRTGTFIALDYLTDFAKAMDYVDVFGCVITLRKQRVNLVQTLEQYVFLHLALVETLMLSSSALPSTQFQNAYRNLLEIDRKTKKRKLDQEFELLRTLSPVTEEAQYLSAKEVHNRSKNRYSNILPVEAFIPKLTPGNSKEDGYVNAVSLPSYKEKMAFIITQTPLESTIEDFWKLVWEYNIHTIVMMNSLSEMQKTEIYWPEGKEHVQFGSISIRFENMMKSDQHTVLTLTVGSFALTRQIKLIQCGGWKSGDSLPESPSVVLSLLELVLSWQRTTGNQTILVHCMNGADKSGLFCVIYAVLDRMKVEQDVAISHTIEEMRNAREQIIPSVEQYKFCLETVLAYIQMNETYSNFTL